MRFLTRRAAQAPAAVAPAPLPPTSLAASAALGRGGRSGATEPWRALTSGYANQRMMADDIGQHILVADVPALPDLPPDSMYVSRPMRGGVRTETPTNGEYRQGVAFGGGHVMQTNRPPLVLVESEQMGPQAGTQPTEWRDAPPVVNLCRRGTENLPGGFAGMPGVS